MSVLTTDRLHEFIAYFEEPEPGVPEGCTGWYHSHGDFPLRRSEDAFAPARQNTGPLVKPGVAGPFSAREEALADLQKSLGV